MMVNPIEDLGGRELKKKKDADYVCILAKKKASKWEKVGIVLT